MPIQATPKTLPVLSTLFFNRFRTLHDYALPYSGRKNDWYNKVGEKVLTVGVPGLSAGFNTYVGNVYSACQQVYRSGSLYHYPKTYDETLPEPRRENLAVALSALGALGRMQKSWLPPGEEPYFISSLISHSWYHSGWKNPPSLDWDKIGRVALSVIYDYEKNNYELTHPAHFRNALDTFHERMKRENGWEGHFFKRDFGVDRYIQLDGSRRKDYIFTLLAACAMHEFFRQPVVSAEDDFRLTLKDTADSDTVLALDDNVLVAPDGVTP